MGGGMVSGGGGDGLLKLMEPETMMKVARLINLRENRLLRSIPTTLGPVNTNAFSKV